MDLLTVAVILDKREKLLDERADRLRGLIEELAICPEEGRLRKLSMAAANLAILRGRWKGLRTTVTGEAIPLGDRPLSPLGVTEH